MAHQRMGASKHQLANYLEHRYLVCEIINYRRFTIKMFLTPDGTGESVFFSWFLDLRQLGKFHPWSGELGINNYSYRNITYIVRRYRGGIFGLVAEIFGNRRPTNRPKIWSVSHAVSDLASRVPIDDVDYGCEKWAPECVRSLAYKVGRRCSVVFLIYGVIYFGNRGFSYNAIYIATHIVLLGYKALIQKCIVGERERTPYISVTDMVVLPIIPQVVGDVDKLDMEYNSYVD